MSVVSAPSWPDCFDKTLDDGEDTSMLDWDLDTEWHESEYRDSIPLETRLDNLAFFPSVVLPPPLPPPSPPRPSSPSQIWHPRLPIDIVDLVADQLQTALTAADARDEGAQLSLVSRDWRDAGQRLVFRKVEASSLGAYSLLVRGTGASFRRLAAFIQVLHLDPLVHQPSERDFHDLLDACTQLREMRVHSVPSTLARCLDVLPQTCGGQHLRELSLVCAPSKEDVDDVKLQVLCELEHLETLALVLPLEYSSVLPSEFSEQQGLSLKSLRLQLVGDDRDTLDASCASICSLVDPATLTSLVFFAETLPPSLLSWLRRAKSLVRMHLAVSAPLVTVLESLIPTSRSLSAVRHLKLQQLRPSALPLRERLLQEPSLASFLCNLPPALDTCAVDLHLATRDQRGAGATWPSFLAARANIGLRRFSYGRIGGKGRHAWTRVGEGERARWEEEKTE
ncbi:hypothetical protein JCM10450v2_001030 [Rhodotorula kratochvilovae]